MTIRFRILGSSSKGNSALLSTQDTCILIDAGFSAKRLQEKLESLGESLAKVDAIFLTHEHSDHTAALRGLSKYPHIKVFANQETATAAQRGLTKKVNWRYFETGATFAYKDMKVSSFPIPHDAADPVGFIFEAGSDDDLFNPKRQVAWATDLGYVPSLVRERVKNADILVLESNYCPDLLDQSPRSYSLKQRIRGRHGHLSNQAAFDLLSTTEKPRWQKVYMAHLSDECNRREVVQQTLEPLRSNGARWDYEIVDPQNGSTDEIAV